MMAERMKRIQAAVWCAVVPSLIMRGYARCAYRDDGDFDDFNNLFGFRVVASPNLS